MKDLGVAEGLAAEIPDDASVVIIAAPEVPLSPEVNGALLRYLDGGGSLMLLLDPGADPLTQLATKLGVTSGDFPLAHAEQFIPQKRGDVDRGLLFSNRFGSHASVKTLSKNSAQLGLILPTTLPIEKDDSAPGKRTTVIRSFPDTWAETNGNYQHDPFEPGKVFDIGVAIDGPEETPYRALVIGDVSVFADPVIKVFKGNQQLAFDSMRWLVGDDDIEGSVESEEDVKIQHTKGEDVWYFYLTGAGVPVLILVLGALVIRLRRRKS